MTVEALSPFITADLWSLTAVCALGAMTPGPSLAVILGVAADQGERAAIIASWSHAIGIGGWAVFTLYGWGELTRSAPWAAQTLSWLGALYLIYLAGSLVRSSEHHEETQDLSLESVSPELVSPELMSPELMSPELVNSESVNHNSIEMKTPQIPSWRSAALSGFVISASNPKIMIFFIAIYAQVLPQTPTFIDRACASLIPLVIDGAWYTFCGSHRSSTWCAEVARASPWSYADRDRGGLCAHRAQDTVQRRLSHSR